MPLGRAAAHGAEPPELAALVVRCQEGDKGALGELYRLFRPEVTRNLQRVLGPKVARGDLEDVLQEVFIEVFRSLPRYRGESKLSTWAGPIAARVAFHYLRSKRGRSERHPPGAVQLHLVGSPEESAQHRQGLQRLYALLRRMTPDQHVAFALFTLDGRSIEEVAELTGVTPVAAKNRICRARQRLWSAARKDPALATYLSEPEAGQ